MLNVHLTLQSRNGKTGPIPVSTTTATTCPVACPFNNAGGCYASGGPLAIHWRKVTQGLAGMPWGEFTAAIAQLPDGTLWRHNQAGDLPGIGDAIDDKALSQLVKANKGRKGFTYTHKPPTPKNLKAIRAANAAGFTVNLSGNNPAHADTLADTNAGPVVTVLPSDQVTNTVTPAGRKIVICPQVTHGVPCIDCGLCEKRNRTVIIGFPAHGASHRKASTIASN